MTALHITGESKRRAPEETKALALEAVRKLLASTSMSRWAACQEVARHIPYSATTIQRWCDDAEVRRDPESDRVRELKAQLAVMRELNQRMTRKEQDF